MKKSLLIALIIAALGVGGWAAYARTKNDSSKKANNTQQPTTTKPAAPSAVVKYLVINEWHIKLPLSSYIADAYYVLSTSSKDTNGQPDTVWLGLASMDNIDSCAAAKANSGSMPLGSLVKTAADATDPVGGELYSQKNPNGTAINGTYYAYQDWISKRPCTTQAAYQSRLQEINKAFGAAALHITN